jgi:hypothetical protein
MWFADVRIYKYVNVAGFIRRHAELVSATHKQATYYIDFIISCRNKFGMTYYLNNDPMTAQRNDQ